MRGPRQYAFLPWLVVLLISSSVAVNVSYVFAANNSVLPCLVRPLCYTAVVMGVWTQALMLMVAFGDPGVISRFEKTHTRASWLKHLALNEAEFSAYKKDPGIWQRSDFYMTRQCDTCRVNRPAKASHCAVCNRCVAGFDHHCTALNTCVGRRTHRSFVLFLVTSLLFALLTTVTSLL